jgi:hypothetical protein
MKGRPEPGDLLAFLYALVLVRQAFWLVPETTAWVASAGVAALAGFLRLRARRARPPLPAAFWLGTAAPLGLFWVLHLPYPDVGFDNLNYHILHGERAVRGLLAIPGDFYPHYFLSLNPAPDMLSAILREVLGYRLGTIGSCLAAVWTGALVFRVLERAIDSRVVCALAALWVVCSEGILWEVGNYMVDLYGLPLLLEAALLVLPGEKETRDPLDDLPLICVLLGTAVAFKLTNLVFAAAIGIVALGRLLTVPAERRDPRRAALSWGLAAAAFFLPMAPHTLLLWWTTGNPVFPHFNALFRSPLFPPFDVRDVRFGPESRLQAFVWPVVSALQPERLSELGRTSGRLALGFLGSVVALLVPHRDRRLSGLAALVILGSLLWSLASGIHRYGLFAELAGGLVLVLLSARGIAAASGRSLALRLCSWLPVAVLAGQSVIVLADVAVSDWSGRATAFHRPRTAWGELRRAGFDRDLKRELPDGLRVALSTFGGWVDAEPTTNGLTALLAPRLPTIGLTVAPYLETPANVYRLDEAFRALEGRTLACLTYARDLELTRSELARNGFLVRRESRYELPFFSSYTLLDIVVLELEAPPPLPLPPGGERRAISARDLVLRRPPASTRAWREDAGLLGSIDVPAEGAQVRDSLLVRGWARMPGEDLTVRVLLDGREREPAEFRRTSRREVEAVVPGLGSCATAGYEARVTLGPQDAGARRLSVVFRSRDGRERHYPERRITVLAAP